MCWEFYSTEAMMQHTHITNCSTQRCALVFSFTHVRYIKRVIPMYAKPTSSDFHVTDCVRGECCVL